MLMRNATDATKLLKRELRNRIRLSLQLLPQARIDQESVRLIKQFTNSAAYRNASSLALYASMPHEFNTMSLLTKAFDDGKKVFLPRVVSKEDHEMLMLECKSMRELNSWEPNSWKIREPPLEEGRLQAPRDVHVDIVVVPGVAFDTFGRRCGQGMGFYDKFLSSYSKSSRRMPHLISLALSVQMIDTVPTDEFDWIIDEVLFEKRGSQEL
ncbi:5-formyltetrahydrofolate cyclo-ligase [Gracilaria domingensis]|nr:5-formyltetrahydrofolate cyclo-ligase [Gracilaria domingensis]